MGEKSKFASMNSKHLLILLFNASSVMNKWSEISSVVDLYHLIAVAIIESWVSDNHDVANLFILNYQIFFENRVDLRGGVVIWLFRSDVAMSRLSLTGVPVSCQMLAIMHKNPEHLRVLIYHPTHCSVEDTLELCDVMEWLSSKYKSISFLGDFNIGLPWIDWSQDPPVPRSRLGDSWLETCEFCNLKLIVNCPMRDDNFLDLV